MIRGRPPGVAIVCLAYFPIRAEAQSAKLLSGRQTKPNKSKENQGKPRKKAWISLDSFGRIGTFQRVTANPNKKILCRSRALSEASQPDALFSSPANRPSASKAKFPE
jgi:hypothetical protein